MIRFILPDASPGSAIVDSKSATKGLWKCIGPDVCVQEGTWWLYVYNNGVPPVVFSIPADDIRDPYIIPLISGCELERNGKWQFVCDPTDIGLIMR